MRKAARRKGTRNLIRVSIPKDRDREAQLRWEETKLTPKELARVSSAARRLRRLLVQHRAAILEEIGSLQFVPEMIEKDSSARARGFWARRAGLSNIITSIDETRSCLSSLRAKLRAFDKRLAELRPALAKNLARRLRKRRPAKTFMMKLEDAVRFLNMSVNQTSSQEEQR